MMIVVGCGIALSTAAFCSLDFTSALIPIKRWLNQILEKLARLYYLPAAAPMIPQHQAKSKETTRVVNHGPLEYSVRGEEERG